MQSDQCILCKNYQGELKCKAFPDGIPTDILQGRFDHKERHPEQDNDILFDSIMNK